MSKYEVIVIGAGHAGVEAALASSRMGAKTLLLTMSADQIATMSCNPAVGGLGKSQLAREVDALGGMMCQMADETAIQYRLLNEKKGPAVRATRVHVDRHEYRAKMKFTVESQENLELKQGQVTELLFDKGRLCGIRTALGQNIYSPRVVITTGTFMKGKAHVGKVNFASGRAGEQPSIGLSDFLSSIGMRIGRLKTGTVPRVDSRTIDYSKIEEQPTQTHCGPLSIFTPKLRDDLESAHLTFTNEKTHDIIRRSLSESPLYSGIIHSTGPRYCPSVEDKIVRYADKKRHQVFLEKEGRLTNEVYVGGLSTSLPYDCQVEFLRSIEGLENVEIVRPGYAIEYDYMDATQLYPTLEVKDVPGLFFAGQVNGTSGYEEAASQGILAGINAGAQAKELDPLILKRSEAYLGVMVDDLVTKGTKEPYRMFTSRAEWRLLLRQDNADVRLISIAHRYGLISSLDHDFCLEKSARRKVLKQKLNSCRYTPTKEVNDKLSKLEHAHLKKDTRASDLLRRPNFSIKDLKEFGFEFDPVFTEDDLKSVETDVKYEGYIKQAEMHISQIEKLDDLPIPTSFEFNNISGLTNEAIEKLSKVRPINLGQAGRVSGITPATLSVIAIHLANIKKKERYEKLACKSA